MEYPPWLSSETTSTPGATKSTFPFAAKFGDVFCSVIALIDSTLSYLAGNCAFNPKVFPLAATTTIPFSTAVSIKARNSGKSFENPELIFIIFTFWDIAHSNPSKKTCFSIFPSSLITFTEYISTF
nr:hypothetical protein [Gracilibacillus boraciitolerans]